MRAFLLLLARMILRPLRAEPLRTALTLAAVSLGVAVVVAIHLAGDAATGSFRSSLESLSGRAALEITATGGVDEQLLGRLAALPLPLEFAPRLEGFAVMEQFGAVVPLVGLDLVRPDQQPAGAASAAPDWEAFRDLRSVWASRALNLTPGQTLRLTINDLSADFTVRGLFDSADRFFVMDIAAAQQALRKPGRLDRIDVLLPANSDPARWQGEIARALPPGLEVRPAGAAAEANRKMLAAFRGNLRVLSYISLVVGGFLIFNTISVSVVRRRAEIGIVRALGATRFQVLGLFLGEAAAFGLAGSIFGLAAGRVMAVGAVNLIGATVESLYVSSSPGALVLSSGAILEAFAVGLGVTVSAALAPAREAALVPPVEAMARGQREYHARIHAARDFAIAAACAVLAYFLAQAPAWNGRPVLGYAAALLLIAASALAIPAAVTAISRTLARLARALLGIEGLLASRGLAASLSRTSVLVAALSTAIAMMASVGILVASFRQTVDRWMAAQLQADLYLRPAAGGGANRHPTLDAALADRIEALPGVAAVDRFRVYDISYRGLPALLGASQTAVRRSAPDFGFLPGQDRDTILAKLPTGDFAILSEPFARKHSLGPGQRLTLNLAGRSASFEILGVYYDYTNERGYVILDRSTLLRYLPDPSPSSLAIYLQPAASLDAVRGEIERLTASRHLVIFSNRSLREEALRVFDRTFAITWALEAVAILVAVLGVAGALLALVIDRRREMALLRFLGASAGQVRKLILAEAGMLGLLANVIGLTLGYALSLILIYVINVQSFGWTIQFHWPVALLVTALTGIYLATLAAALYPARVAVRLNPIAVIHEE